MDIPFVKQVIFPEDIKDMVCGCVFLLFIMNWSIHRILRKLTWWHFFLRYLPFSIMALLGLITWYLIYTHQKQALGLWYFWPFLIMPFVIGFVVCWLIPYLLNKPWSPETWYKKGVDSAGRGNHKEAISSIKRQSGKTHDMHQHIMVWGDP